MDIKTNHNLNTEEHIIVHLLAWVSSVWQVESSLAQVIYPKHSTLTVRLSEEERILLKININALRRSIYHFGIIGPKLDLEKPQGLWVWKGTEALVRSRLVLNASSGWSQGGRVLQSPLRLWPSVLHFTAELPHFLQWLWSLGWLCLPQGMSERDTDSFSCLKETSSQFLTKILFIFYFFWDSFTPKWGC